MTIEHDQSVTVCSAIWLPGEGRKLCDAWGVPSVHGCKKDPAHDGPHVCLCGARRQP